MASKASRWVSLVLGVLLLAVPAFFCLYLARHAYVSESGWGMEATPSLFVLTLPMALGLWLLGARSRLTLPELLPGLILSLIACLLTNGPLFFGHFEDGAMDLLALDPLQGLLFWLLAIRAVECLVRRESRGFDRKPALLNALLPLLLAAVTICLGLLMRPLPSDLIKDPDRMKLMQGLRNYLAVPLLSLIGAAFFGLFGPRPEKGAGAWLLLGLGVVGVIAYVLCVAFPVEDASVGRLVMSLYTSLIAGESNSAGLQLFAGTAALGLAGLLHKEKKAA